MIGLNIEKPILLAGEIGYGKIYIIELLATLVGVSVPLPPEYEIETLSRYTAPSFEQIPIY